MKRFSHTLYIIIIGLALQLPLSGHAATYSLQQCIEMALQSNADLKKARLDIEMADEDKADAYTNFFPQVSAMGVGIVGAKHLMRSNFALPPEMGGMSFPMEMMKKGVVASITALQPLYMGGQVVNGNKLAAVQQEVRRLQLEMTEKDIVQNVQTYYWKLVALRSNIATLDAVDKQLEGIHKLTKDFVEAGVINRNDLLRVEIKQQEMQSQRLTLNNGIELVRMLLAQLVGTDLQSFDIAPTDIFEPKSPDSYFVPSDQAVAQREEVELTQKAVTASELQVKMERGKNLPSVAVGASGIYMNLMEENQGNLIGLATVSVPISSWWGGTHKMKKAKMALEQSKIVQHDTQEKLAIDVLHAWNNLNEAYAQIQIAQSSIKQADENLRLQNDQYGVGALPMTDLLDALTLYQQTHNQYASACADYQSRIAEYLRKTK